MRVENHLHLDGDGPGFCTEIPTSSPARDGLILKARALLVQHGPPHSVHQHPTPDATAIYLGGLGIPLGESERYTGGRRYGQRERLQQRVGWD